MRISSHRVSCHLHLNKDGTLTESLPTALYHRVAVNKNETHFLT